MNSNNSTKTPNRSSSECPYLDTINRNLLDFDFEHSCSISLNCGPHIYACLVCGKFFQGRGEQSPAYLHSVNENHFVYVHLLKGTFHCLPDDYEIVDPSLSDISAALNPKFTIDEIRGLDDQTILAQDLFGRRYLPGFVGLNNLNKTDYINATMQALAHVRPLRDFFLKQSNYNTNRSSSPLVRTFGELVRKMWSDKRFKSNVDPHMFVQSVIVSSNKRFVVGKQAEAGEFIAWLLHHLHLGLGGSSNPKKKKKKKTIIQQVFQGKVEVTSRKRVKKRHLVDHDKVNDVDNAVDDRIGSDDEQEHDLKLLEQERLLAEGEKWIIDESNNITHFLQLTLDIPEKPLFKDDDGGLVIPQEPLVSVLQKFDGFSFHDVLTKQQTNNNTTSASTLQKRRYRLLELPNYLILHLSRFTKNSFSMDKNPTIVAFPVKNLDLSRYVFDQEDSENSKKKSKLPTEEQVRAMSEKELRKLFLQYHRPDIANNPNLSKSELLQTSLNLLTTSFPQLLSNKYDLIANITHDSPPEVGREGKKKALRRNPLEEGTYRCHVQHKATGGQWYEVQDLHVQETMPQLIGLSESYVLIFERKGLYSSTV